MSDGTVPACQAELAAILGRLNVHEQRAVVMLARRIEMGSRAYGPFDPSTDTRDMRKERAEEAADYAIYSVLDRLIRQIAGEGRGVDG